MKKSKPKKKELVRWIDRSLLLSPYYIGFCQSEEAFRAALKHLKIPKNDWPEWITPGSDGTTHYFEHTKNGNLCSIVCVKPYKGMPFIEMIGLIVHESSHVFDTICENIGEDKPGSEFKAYALQNISSKLIEEYQKK